MKPFCLMFSVVWLVHSLVFGAGMLDSLPTEELIGKLTEESNQGIGSHTTAWASGFMAIDDEPRFNGGILGSQKPVVSPVMRELVRRGLAALPLLMDHLTDERPAKLIVGDGFTGKWFADEYDARDANSKQLGAVNTKKEIRFDHYTLRVGDLCYVAVGQIVNRELCAVRYQPSLCLVVNSPVEMPALATAVKSEWGGLTAADHQRSLEQDSISPHSVFAPGAGLKRLVFYYPQAGEQFLLKMLGRPFYNRRRALDFFQKTLAHSPSDEWDRLMAGFRVKYGEADFLGVEQWTLHAFNFPEPQMSPERRQMKNVAAQVLQRFFADVDPYRPPFINAVSIADQKSLIEDLAAIHSPAVEDAVLRILKRVAALPPAGAPDERFYQCALACTCAQRWSGPGDSGAPARALLENMIAAFQKTRKSQHGEDVAAFDKNIKYLQGALLAMKVLEPSR